MHRYNPHLITLGQCRLSQMTALEFRCIASDRACFHSATISILDVIARWGEDRRPDDLPLYCGKCRAPRFNADGRLNIAVTPIWPRAPGQGSMSWASA